METDNRHPVIETDHLPPLDPEVIARPLALHEEEVVPAYLDYNGHMNLAYYVLVFDHATDEMFDFLGLDRRYREQTGYTTFALESHVTYEREVLLGDRVRITTQLLDYDAKRLHYFHRMYHAREGWLSATTELISLHIDTRIRRSAPMPGVLLERIGRVMDAHRRLPRPEQAGRVIGIRRRGGGTGTQEGGQP